jgi:hypothetical protein
MQALGIKESALKVLVLPIIILMLSGCVSIPDTEEQLRANPYKVETWCSPLSFVDTYTLIAKHTTRCHAQNDDAIIPVAGAFIPLSTQDIVLGQVIETNKAAKVTVEYLNPVEGGFLQAIDILATESCPALVSVYVLNDTTKWETATQSVAKWLEGDSQSCFELF